MTESNPNHSATVFFRPWRARPSGWAQWLLLVLLIGATSPASAQTTSSWLNAVDGDWDDPAKWSTAVFPDNGSPSPSDTYRAVIDATGSSPYTVDLQTEVTLDSLVLNSANATLALKRFGDLNVLSPFELRAGTFAILGGRISGGTIRGYGGSMEVGGRYSETSTFDGVTLDTDLTLKDRATLRIENGLVLQAGRKIRFTADRNLVVMTFVGDQTLSGEGEIVFGPTPSMDYNRISLEPGTTLTIGPDITVRTEGANGRLGHSTVGNGIINQGLISGEIDDERAMRIDGPTFENQGIVQAINGGRVILDGDWTNNGIFRVDGGTIDLDSEFTNADIGTVDYISGHIRITGTLHNAGTLTVDGSTFPVELAGSARIVGGAIASADGTPLAVRYAELDGVLLDADAVLGGPGFSGGHLEILNGLTLNNRTISLLGSETGKGGSLIQFRGTQTLDGQGVIRCEGGRSVQHTITSVGTLTIGPDIVIENVSGGYLELFSQGGALVNNGLIKSGPARRLTISGQDWVNNGTIEVEPGATLLLDGTVKTADLGTIVNDSGLVILMAMVDNTGRTLDLNGTFGSFRLAGGTIKGGTLAGIPPLYFDRDSGGILDGVILDVDTLLGENERLVIENGLTLNNRKIKFTSGGDLLFAGTQTLGGTGELIVNSFPSSSGYTTIVGGSGLVIGPDITIRTGNDAGGSFIIEVSGDGLINQGTIIVDKGTVKLGGSGWSNQGLIQHSGGSLHLGGSYTTAAIGNLMHTGGDVILEGTMDNTGNTFLLDASTGSWRLSSGRIVGGRIETTDGAELIAGRLGNNRQAFLEGVTLAGDMRLDDCELRIENNVTFDGGTVSIVGARSSRIVLSDTQSISGHGEIVFDGQGNENRLIGDDLTIGEGVTIRTGMGSGQIGLYRSPLNNEGTISAQTPGQEISVKATFANSGTLKALNNGKLIIASADWTNDGTVSLYNGTVEVTASSITNATAGRIEGIGTLDGAGDTTFINSGTVAPGIPSDLIFVPGSLVFDGDYRQNADGLLWVDVRRAITGSFDSVAVSGTAELAGSLEVSLFRRARFEYGDTLDFLTATSVTGEFEELILPTFPGGEPMFSVSYGPDRVTLTYVPEPATFTLAAAGGLLLLGYFGRRKRINTVAAGRSLWRSRNSHALKN